MLDAAANLWLAWEDVWFCSFLRQRLHKRLHVYNCLSAVCISPPISTHYVSHLSLCHSTNLFLADEVWSLDAFRCQVLLPPPHAVPLMHSPWRQNNPVTPQPSLSSLYPQPRLIFLFYSYLLYKHHEKVAISVAAIHIKGEVNFLIGKKNLIVRMFVFRTVHIIPTESRKYSNC